MPRIFMSGGPSQSTLGMGAYTRDLPLTSIEDARVVPGAGSAGRCCSTTGTAPQALPRCSDGELPQDWHVVGRLQSASCHVLGQGRLHRAIQWEAQPVGQRVRSNKIRPEVLFWRLGVHHG